MCLVMNGKKMIGDDMEKGLAQLKVGGRDGQVGEQLTALLLALADMIELRFGRPALAIVAVGLAVAAADREIILRAHGSRLLDAGSGSVGDAALPGRMFAP